MILPIDVPASGISWSMLPLNLPIDIEKHKPKNVTSAVPINPIYERIGSLGYITLWVNVAILVLSFIGFTFLALRVPVQKRLYHVLAIVLTVITIVGNFAMASGDGSVFIADSTQTLYRQLLWARYAYWVFTTPLFLLYFLFLGGLGGASIFITLVADELMVFLGLFASLSDGDVLKWTYYVFSYLAYIVVVYQLAIVGRRAVATKDKKTVWLYKAISSYALVLWALYGVVWALGTGARIVSVDIEIVGYATLDFLAVPILGLWLLLTHGRNAESIEGFWVHGLRSEGTLRLGDGS